MDTQNIPRDNLDRVVFKTNMPSIKMAKSRRIATLARRALIKYDPELEKRLRILEDLPTSMLDKQIEEWKKTGMLPQVEPEKDIRVRPERDIDTSETG